MFRMVVTLEVSHALMSSLKDAAAVLQALPVPPQNKPDMDVTLDVSHFEMWPYVASTPLSESHWATAQLIVLSVMT
jgi:hypothetical protein